jgi:butyryl-CoA dehydrogenase
MRIHPIHEGTTGIQSITLLGRGITMKNGKAFHLFLEEIQDAVNTARADTDIAAYADKLVQAAEKLKEVTNGLIGVAVKGNIELFLADATLYMELFGIVAIAWQWLLQAIALNKAIRSKPTENDLNFYQGKLCVFRYFFGYELPKTEGLYKVLLNADGLTLEMHADLFSD